MGGWGVSLAALELLPAAAAQMGPFPGGGLGRRNQDHVSAGQVWGTDESPLRVVSSARLVPVTEDGED